MTARESQTIQSSEKMITIINELTDRGETGVTELANATGYHKSTVYVHLQTLLDNDLVVNRGGSYRLSLQFLTISEQVRDHHPVYDQGWAEIDSLASMTGELAFLAVPENGMVVVVYTARGQKATQSISDGTRVPMISSPMGKVLLAFAPDTDDEDWLAKSTLERDWEDKLDEDLDAELAGIRGDGFYVSADESAKGMPYIAEPEPDKPRSQSHRTDVQNRIVAAPVIRDEVAVASVGVTGSSKRISGEYREQVRRQVVQTAATIEQKLTLGDIES